MRERIIGYWTLSWVGLLANIVALPVITLVTIYKPLLKVADMTLAISLGWPAAIIGIVSSSALLAERKWGVILALISSSMVISGLLPYSIVRLVNFKDYIGIGCLITAIFNVLALIYWCLPNHRKEYKIMNF